MGFLAFLLKSTTEPCSVPTWNFVGMVLSYSRDTAPQSRPSSFGSMYSVSVGSDSLRTSQNRTCPSVEHEKASVPDFVVR